MTRTVCDLNYDPFRYMQDHGKKYGWTISLYEYEATIPTLWQHTKGAIVVAMASVAGVPLRASS